MRGYRLRTSASTVGLACCLALGTTAVAAAAASTTAATTPPDTGAPAALRIQLLQSAQRWSDKGRSDVARQMLAKLLAMEPDSPEGLVFMADLALRDNQLDAARKILDTLQTRQPQHPATHELERLYQVYSQQREKLARMRLTARAGRTAEAAALARELFPEGPPRYSALGQEIARITGQRGTRTDSVLAQAPARQTAAPAGRARAKPAPPSAVGAVARTPHAPSGTAVATAARPAAAPLAAVTASPAADSAATTSASAAAQTAAAPAALAPSPQPGVSEPPAEASLAAARADMLRAQANAEIQAERLSPALRLLEQAVQLTPDDAWLRYALARLYTRLQLPQQARSVATEGVERAPADTDMRYARALLLASLDEDAAALNDLQQIAPAERSAGMQALEQRLQRALQAQAQQAQDKLEREVQAIEARRQARVEVGQLTLQKNSTEGLSSLRGWERPVVAWLPWGYQGMLFAHMDSVHLVAGSYAGGDPFAQPGTEAITSGLPQHADGMNLGVGYVGDDLRWDLGEIGLGFAVTNWVGGLRYSGDRGALAYSLELSRRPLTGTLLSYAGTTDPQTQGVWGGVVATGVGGRVATEIGPFNTSFSASVASLTGQNVADNTRLQWRLAADRDVYNSATQDLNVGLSLSGLQHAKDLSNFTWGHGGYYSPVSNVTLSLPVQWSGREGPFTWLLKASVSVSSSSSTATDFYPGNAAMQQQAGNPVYAASSSTGTGWAASGAAEYQLSPNLALGARLDREVSDYYAPLNLLLYARYAFDPVREPLAKRPRPVQPYSQF